MSNELIHHGVKGMKWGVRRDRGLSSKGKTKLRKKKSSAGIEPAKQAPRSYSEDYISKVKASIKSPSEMSNAELRSFTERIRLEQEYARLTAKPKSKWKAAAAEVLASAAKQTAKNYVTAYMGVGVEKILGKPPKTKTDNPPPKEKEKEDEKKK